MRPTSMPGIAMSEPYCAVPVTFGTPSGRTGRVPTHLKVFSVSRAATSFTAASPVVAHVLGEGSRGPSPKCKPSLDLRTDRSRAGLAFCLAHSGDAMPMLAYTAPSTVEEAVRILAGASGVAKVLSGGTDLLVQLRSGRTKPELIVDTKKIPGISGIREQDGAFIIGAATSGAVIGENEALRRAWPGVVEATNLIGSTQVQGRASLAGNLCNASPAADSVPALIAARATCVVVGANGRREVPVESIVTGPGRTSLKPGRVHHRVSSAQAPAPLGGRLPALHSADRDGHRGGRRGRSTSRSTRAASVPMRGSCSAPSRRPRFWLPRPPLR